MLFGCTPKDEEIQASAAPTTTGIPMGAPGAVGARVEAPPPTPGPRVPRLEGLEQKINPGPTPTVAPTPVIPPSPFGTPPEDDPLDPEPTTKKKPKGTKI